MRRKRRPVAGMNSLKLNMYNCHLIIDGIFGTGFRGNPEGTIARTIQMVKESKCPVLAIDIPSGLDSDSGQAGQPCIQADYTVTLAWPKRGLVVFPGKSYVGQLFVADISLPVEGLFLLEKAEYLVTPPVAKELLPTRDWEGHKNAFGHVLVVAGSQGMMGAAYLASKASLRVGAGLVTACVPASLAPLFDLTLPEALTKGVAETKEGFISPVAWKEISALLGGKKALVVGPGLGDRKSVV